MNLYTWTRDGVVISDSDPLFSQTLTLTNRSTVTSQLVLSSANISSLVGTYKCIVTDSNRRRSTSSQVINGNFLSFNNLSVNMAVYVTSLQLQNIKVGRNNSILKKNFRLNKYFS